MKAYIFTDNTHKDGKTVLTVGETLAYSGPLKIWYSGLHASLNILDALRYASGPFLFVVECKGDIIHRSDRLVCSTQTILRIVNCSGILRDFACWSALQLTQHYWNSPDTVVEYLRTKNEAIRKEAHKLARDASGDGARAAERASEDNEVSAASRGLVWTELIRAEQESYLLAATSKGLE